MPSNHSTAAVPAALGFRMPAEWEPHAATWLTWPHNLESWPDGFESIPGIWVELVRVLRENELVHVLVNDTEAEERAGGLLRDAAVGLENVVFHQVPSNDAWMRDHGPTFLTRPTEAGPEVGAVNWIYNAWGGKYPPYDLDAVIGRRVTELTAARHFEPGIVLEGGSIEVNGRGTLMTTEACLLNPNRNPHLSKADIETVLRDYLGVRHVLWLGDGIAGDDTDGHIDDLARFTGAGTVATVVAEDPNDENFEVLQDNLRRLEGMTDQDGRPLRIVRLPMPRPIHREGRRLPASYANFYVANGVVVAPVFDDPMDGKALSLLAELFPARRVVGIVATDLVWGLGAFHCITQQQPALL
jgi:agmatine deiminase